MLKFFKLYSFILLICISLFFSCAKEDLITTSIKIDENSIDGNVGENDTIYVKFLSATNKKYKLEFKVSDKTYNYITNSYESIAEIITNTNEYVILKYNNKNTFTLTCNYYAKGELAATASAQISATGAVKLNSNGNKILYIKDNNLFSMDLNGNNRLLYGGLSTTSISGFCMNYSNTDLYYKSYYCERYNLNTATSYTNYINSNSKLNNFADSKYFTYYPNDGGSSSYFYYYDSTLNNYSYKYGSKYGNYFSNKNGYNPILVYSYNNSNGKFKYFSTSYSYTSTYNYYTGYYEYTYNYYLTSYDENNNYFNVNTWSGTNKIPTLLYVSYDKRYLLYKVSDSYTNEETLYIYDIVYNTILNKSYTYESIGSATLSKDNSKLVVEAKNNTYYNPYSDIYSGDLNGNLTNVTNTSSVSETNPVIY